MSLYAREAQWVDETTQVLRRAGIPKASRSLVIREAILGLGEALAEKSPDQILQYFIVRGAKSAQVLLDRRY